MGNFEEIAVSLSNFLSLLLNFKEQIDISADVLESKKFLPNIKIFQQKADEYFIAAKKKIEEFTGKKTNARLEINNDTGRLENFIKYYPFPNESKSYLLKAKNIFTYYHVNPKEVEELVKKNFPFTLSLLQTLWSRITTVAEYYPTVDLISFNFSELRRENATKFEKEMPTQSLLLNSLESFTKVWIREEVIHSCFRRLIFDLYDFTNKSLTLLYKLGEESMEFFDEGTLKEINKFFSSTFQYLFPWHASLPYPIFFPLEFEKSRRDDFKKLEQLKNKSQFINELSEGLAYFILEKTFEQDPAYLYYKKSATYMGTTSFLPIFYEFFDECYKQMEKQIFEIIESSIPFKEEVEKPYLYLQRVRK